MCNILYTSRQVHDPLFKVITGKIPFHVETPDFELPDDLKKTICLRAGGSLRLCVKVTGRPFPDVSWSKPGTDLHNRGFIEVNSTSTTLIIDKVHRYDAGKYTLLAENSAGKQEVNILVKIYGTLLMRLTNS